MYYGYIVLCCQNYILSRGVALFIALALQLCCLYDASDARCLAYPVILFSPNIR